VHGGKFEHLYAKRENLDFTQSAKYALVPHVNEDYFQKANMVSLSSMCLYNQIVLV
jgi:hypothetical protein